MPKIYSTIRPHPQLYFAKIRSRNESIGQTIICFKRKIIGSKLTRFWCFDVDYLWKCPNELAHTFDYSNYWYAKIILENSPITPSLFCRKPEHKWINWTKDNLFKAENYPKHADRILAFWRRLFMEMSKWTGSYFWLLKLLVCQKYTRKFAHNSKFILLKTGAQMNQLNERWICLKRKIIGSMHLFIR